MSLENTNKMWKVLWWLKINKIVSIILSLWGLRLIQDVNSYEFWSLTSLGLKKLEKKSSQVSFCA